jgi:peptidoglycan/xylan/chitin deacetylase (PgdA/CDA1 family)/spore germination protein YaaH
MNLLLIDPSLRRARLVRVAVGALASLTVAAALVFAYAVTRPSAVSLRLPAPPPAPFSARRRPVRGQRPAAGQLAPTRAAIAGVPLPLDGALRVTAFVDPAQPGARASLERHGAALSAVAPIGLRLGDGGAIVGRLDRELVELARARRLPVLPVVQNVDDEGARWRPDRVRALEGDAAALRRFSDALERLCRDGGFAGAHLDLEELDARGWSAVERVVRAVGGRLHARGLRLVIDVPAGVSPSVLARLADADQIVVMAYDEHDEAGPPGAVASERFVDAALAGAATVAPARLVAGLGIYAYDWVGREPATALSFADALAAAKEANVAPTWDAASGSAHFDYADDEGRHQVWLLDGASLFNQLRSVRRRGIREVALWRLGAEDPAVWDALAADAAASLASRAATVAPESPVEIEGQGPFLSLARPLRPGRRALEAQAGRIVDERWLELPSGFRVRRAGVVPGKVALTFDDGPDPRSTPAILDALRRAGVPATFFVVGLNAARAPDLVRRAFAEGHVIGNHSFTHPDIERVGDGRLQMELEGTARLVETLIGRRPLVYRPPALADVAPRTVGEAAAFARVASLGHLVVDADVDPRDWECPSAAELTDRVLRGAAHGGVVLLHDGGGDRATTVAALPSIIDGLRRRGLAIVPLAELLGKPPEALLAAPATRAPLARVSERALFRGTAWAVRWAAFGLTAALLVLAARALALIGLALASEPLRRRRRPGPLPSVSVVIPAFNEAAVIERTVGSVLASDLPVRVIVIDDGSTDGTADEVRRAFGRDPRVRLVRQRNAGKSAALRAGFAVAEGEVVVALDGDTLFAPTTVRRLVEPFVDRRVGAVAGTAEVGNRENALCACQAVEYLVQQEIERRAWDALRALPVVPGAVGAWRRRAVAEVGGFSSETLAEDADLSIALCRAGWRVVHAPEARARTEVPVSVRALVRQRVRWSFGVLQALWKHRRALVERRAGALGRIVLPMQILSQVALPLLVPLALAGAVLAALGGNFAAALWASAALLAVELAQGTAAAALAARSGDRAGARLLPWIVVARILYRPLLYAVLVRSLARVIDGIPLGWNKLARRGTVHRETTPIPTTEGLG